MTFRVPVSWKENYEPDGGAEFFDEVTDSPTLRLNVITARRPGVTQASATEALQDFSASPAQIEQLSPGVALVRYSEHAQEFGEQLACTYWLMAHAVPPDCVRIANFSWTVLERCNNNPAFVRDFELMDREIRAATVSREVAVQGR